MKHVDEGTLRRLLDEPQGVVFADRQHVAGCAACQARRAEIEAAAGFASELLAVTPPATDTVAALRRLQGRLATEPAGRWTVLERVTNVARLSRRQLVRSAAGLGAAAAVTGALALTPAGAWASNFLVLFEPKQVVAVPINAGDLRGLPDLSNYGTMVAPPAPKPQSLASAAAASAAAQMAVLQPGWLPASVPTTPRYSYLPSASASFTFSAAKAKQAAAAQGKGMPVLPANVDGSTIHVTTGAAVVTTYGGDLNALASASVSDKQASGAGKASGSGEQSGATERSVESRLMTGDVPGLIIGQMKAPLVTSTGVTVAQLEQLLLNQPGISPSLAAAIRAIGDPTSTLPIPIPISQAASHPIKVQDVSGLSVADSTGIGGGIIWVKDGVIYGVAGPLTEHDLLTVANSLH